MADEVFLRPWVVVGIKPDKFFQPARYRSRKNEATTQAIGEAESPLAWKETVLGKSGVFDNGWDGAETQPGPAKLNLYRTPSADMKPRVNLTLRASGTSEHSGDDASASGEVQLEDRIHGDTRDTSIATSASKASLVGSDHEDDKASVITQHEGTEPTQVPSFLTSVTMTFPAQDSDDTLAMQLDMVARKAQAAFLLAQIASCDEEAERTVQETQEKLARVEAELLTAKHDMTALMDRCVALEKEAGLLYEHSGALVAARDTKAMGMKKKLDEIKYQELLSSSL